MGATTSGREVRALRGPGAANPARAILRAYAGVWPRIHPDAWIAPGAVVVGDVEIGADSSVWYASVLRGDVHGIRVGSRSNLQDGCVLHVTRDRFACVIGDEVTVGHRAVVHGCRVGDGALIGIGAIVLDGAEVGDEALIGAGSVVTPGTRIPERWLAVGTPARPVRELGAGEIQEQRARTLAYVDTARRHRSEDAQP
ncbi:MAG TPA: gamma carbonic anhydrase family protein [Myxococcota bacterium]|jgi:carbonic anhydrase/acetyltransferase-like protein (isoleucine patch superfamily)